MVSALISLVLSTTILCLKVSDDMSMHHHVRKYRQKTQAASGNSNRFQKWAAAQLHRKRWMGLGRVHLQRLPEVS